MPNQTIYVDPSYTAAITGKTHATTGEVLNYGVNAFAVLNEAVPALHSGDSLYINGLTSDISVAVPVSLHLTDSTAPVLAVGPVAAETTASGALDIAILGSTIAAGTSYLAGKLGTLDGSVSVLIEGSVLGDATYTGRPTPQFILAESCTFGSKTGSIAVTIRNSAIDEDISLIHDSVIGTKAKPASITLTLDHVVASNDKWFWISNSKEPESSYADVTFNVVDSRLGNNGTMGLAVHHDSGDGDALLGNVTYNLSGTYFSGNLYPVSTVRYKKPSVNTGVFTLNVTGGSSHVESIGGFDVISIAAGASLSAVSLAGTGTVYVSGALRAPVIGANELHLLSGGTISGPVDLSGTSVFAESGSMVVFDIAGVEADGDALFRDLSVFENIPDFTLSVSCFQEEGSYMLAEGASGFGKTITVVNFLDGSVLGTISVGETLELFGQTWTLDLSDEYLYLEIWGEPTGSASGMTVDAGRSIFVTSGQAVDGATVRRGGMLEIGEEASATEIEIDFGGTARLGWGGFASGVEVNSLGTLIVNGGASATDVLENGGYVDVLGWGGDNVEFRSNTLSGMYLSRGSATIHSNTAATGVALSFDGELHIFSGGTADDIRVSEGGRLFLSEGGMAEKTEIKSGGKVTILGGTAGDLRIDRGGSLGIGYSGSASKVYISAGGSVTVSGGGLLEGVEIAMDGKLTISSGGTAILDFNPWKRNYTAERDAVVMFYDREANVYYGGTKDGILDKADSMSSMTVTSGTSLLVYSGGRADHIEVVKHGLLQVSEGGAVQDIVVSAGGTATIKSGGTAVRITENGGAVGVEEGANVTFVPVTLSGLVITGGVITVHSGTSVIGLTGYNYSFAQLDLLRGGYVKDVDLFGWTVIAAGGVLENISVRNTPIYVSSGAKTYDVSLGRSGYMCVSSGGLVSGVAIVSGELYVQSGATATDIDWMPGQGKCTVESGAVVRYTNEISEVYYGSKNEILSHARVMAGKEVGWETSMYVMSGGTAVGNTVSAGQLYVSSGGIAKSTTLCHGGSGIVNRGGVMADTVIDLGGVMAVSRGGVASGVKLQSGNLDVYDGGVVRDLDVEDGLWFHVSSGGTVTGRIRFAGHPGGFDLTRTAPDDEPLVNTIGFYENDHPDYSLTISSALQNGKYILAGDASTFNKTITVRDSSGFEHGTISLGATETFLGADYTLSLDGETLVVTISGDGERPDTVAPIVFDVGVDNIMPTDRDVTVTAEFYDDVKLASTLYRIGETGEWQDYTGGLVFSENATVYFKAVDTAGNESEIVGYEITNIDKDAPDVVSGLTVKNDSKAVFASKTYLDTTLGFNGWLYVSGGGTASGTNVKGMGKLYVSSGGTAMMTTIRDGGLVLLESGASGSGANINFGGRLVLSPGASYDNVNISPDGSMTLSAGASAKNVTVASGGCLFVFDDAQIDSLTVDFGAIINIANPAVVTNLFENGGYVNTTWKNITFAPNTFSGITISGGSATIHSGTTALDTTLGEMGAFYVYDGGRISGTTFNNGAFAHISSGAVADGVTLNSGGMIYVSSGGTALNILENCGGVVAEEGAVLSFIPNTISGYTATVVSMTLHSGSILYDLTAEVFGNVFVYDGGRVERARLNQGHLYIQSGGTATNIVVNNKDLLIVSSGGVATDILVTQADDANYAAVSIQVNGGTASNTTLRGKFSDVLASAKVQNNGQMIDTLVQYRGFLLLSSGGIARDTVVSSGGRMYVYSGGTASNTTVSSGGTMYAAGSARVTGRMTFSEDAVVDIDGAVFDFDISELAPKPNAIVNNLSVVTGLPQYVITVGDGQTNGTYTLAKGAKEFSGTITVRNTHDRRLGTLEVGGVLTVGTATYTLNKKDGELTLTVSGSFDPGPDAVPPTVTNIRANTTDPTHWDVVVTADFEDDVEVVSKWYRIGEDGEWKVYVNGATVSQNDTVYFKAVDFGNNESEIASYEVKNIDKIDPAPPTAYADITEPTTGEVRVTAEFSEDSVVREYMISYASYAVWLPYDGAVVMELNGEVTFRAVDAAGNRSFLIFKVNNIDHTAPVPPLVYADTTSPTNGPVFVTADFCEDSVFGEYSFDRETWHEYTAPVEFTENGTVWFRCTDEVGNVSTATYYYVNNIDKAAPEKPTASADITALTNKDVTVTAVFSNDTAVKEYSFDGETWLKYTDGVVMTKNGTVQFRAADAAGNYSEVVSFAVENIDKTVPEKPTASADVTELTNGDVVVTAVFSEDSVTKEYSLDGKKWIAYPDGGVVMTGNGTVRFRGTNAAGTVSDVVSFAVKNIDKVAPVKPTASADITALTNKDVTVTAVFSKDSVKKEYTLDGGATWQAYDDVGVIIIIINGTVGFRGTDAAGNVSEVTTLTVDNIDKVAPTAPTGLSAVVADRTVTLSWAASADDLAGVKEYVLTYSHDGEEFSTTTAETSFMLENVDFATWQWSVSAVDAVGNVSEIAAGEAFVVDQAAPTKKFVTKSDIDGNGVSDVMFVWTGEHGEGNYQQGYWLNGTATWQSANAAHPSDWIPLGAHDMNNNGKADSVMFGNVYTETSGKGAYIGYYLDADDNSTPEHPTWQNIGYLNNEEDITWQNCVGNLNGEKNSIVWYAPDLYAVGIWVGQDEYPEWIHLSASFGGPDWNLVGCGDFDGDGKDSVVMSGLNGQYFYIVGIDEAPTSLGSANWSGWEIRAIGDFAGDGKDDLVLFHKETGAMVMCADGNTDSYTSIGQLDASDWFVVGAGDYNNDSKDDLLVRQYSTGMLGYYSSGDVANGWVTLGYGVDMSWTVIA